VKEAAETTTINQHSTGERYWEIDAMRGAAILGMLVFHFLAALVTFGLIQETETFLKYYNTYIFGTGVFVILAGIAMVLRHERMRVKGKTNRDYYKALVGRALLLFVIAMMITLVTWIFGILATSVFGMNSMENQPFIKFGFLHMLAISMLIAIPLLRFQKWNLVFGLILLAIGIFLIPNFTSPEWLFPLGIHSPEFLSTTQDYFPLLPWAGILLIGVGLGNVFYPNGIRGFKLNYKPKKVIQFLSKIGNGTVTLIIYLVHMPVIYVILWIFVNLCGFGT